MPKGMEAIKETQMKPGTQYGSDVTAQRSEITNKIPVGNDGRPL